MPIAVAERSKGKALTRILYVTFNVGALTAWHRTDRMSALKIT